MSRQRKIPTPAWQRDGGLSGGLTSDRGKLFGLIGVVILIVAGLGFIGFGYLSDYITDQQRPGSTAIKIDDRKYSVSDYTERVKLYAESSGNTSASVVIPTVSGAIIEEALLLAAAPGEGIEVTDDEIKAQIAELLGITADDANFDARYQEELDSIDLSETEYRDLARGNVLKTKVQDKFSAELPATADSVHYRQIQVEDQATADEVLAEIEAGGDFVALAAERSLDTATKDTGGDMGWTPRGILTDALENLLFSMEAGEYNTYPTSSAVFIFEMLEKDPERALEEEDKPTLSSQEYNDWITLKRDAAEIENEMDPSTGDGDKIRYVIDHADLVLG